MKKQIITPNMIKEATIAYVAEYGLENLTTKKVALSMNISEGTIFNNFSNKKELLKECLYYIDIQIDQIFKNIPFHGLNISKTIRELWFSYFNYLVAHGSYAKFYLQYRQSSYYTDEVIAGQDQTYSFFVSFIHKNAHRFGFNPDIYWVFIIETTLNFAVRVVDGQLPGDPKSMNHFYGLLSHGFIGNMKIGKKE